MSETEIVRALDSEDIKDGVAAKIAESVRESMNTSCWLYGMAWPKVKADWRIHFTLENRGEEREVVVDGVLHTQDWKDGNAVLVGGELPGGKEFVVEGEIPYMPPNVFRREMHLPVPIVVNEENGSTQQKAVIFRQTRKPRHE